MTFITFCFPGAVGLLKAGPTDPKIPGCVPGFGEGAAGFVENKQRLINPQMSALILGGLS